MVRLLFSLCAAVFLLWPRVGECGDRIIVAGTGDGQEVFEQLAQAYMAANPGDVIDLPASVGTSGGVRSVAAGTCDVARMARPLKEKEKRFQLSYRALARVPVVLAAHPGVKVRSVTKAQAVAVLTGGITNWRVLGGPDHKIHVFQRETGEASFVALARFLPELEGKPLVGKVAFTAPENLEEISRNEFSLGYVSLAAARRQGLSIVWIEGHAPAEGDAASPGYPIMMTHGLAWSPEAVGPAKRFIDFSFSPEGRAVLDGMGVFPPAP